MCLIMYRKYLLRSNCFIVAFEGEVIVRKTKEKFSSLPYQIDHQKGSRSKHTKRKMSNEGELLKASSNSAPSARRSVSFGPASISTSTNGNVPTILDQTSKGGGESSTSSHSVNPHQSGTSRRVASGSSTVSGEGGEGSIQVGSISMTPSGSSTGAIGNTSGVLKPALKAGTDHKKLPPQSHYQHPDPLLRRLRLVDDKGNAINLKDFFDGVKIVAFYFSSQWAGQPLKEYHNTISEFAREHQREFKVIYVSVDVDEQWYKAGVKGQPWVSMVWNDGSSLPSPNSTNSTSPSAATDDDPLPPLFNNENFLLAQEFDIDESLSKTDTSGEAYLRPFSRVHLASKLNIIAAPTVCIYHIEKQKMLDWNVRMARLHRDQRDETWSRWKKGESAKSFGFTEALANSPGTVSLAIFVAIYWMILLLGGQKYNFLRQAFESLNPSANSASSSGSAIQQPAEALEKVINSAREHVDF